MIRTLLILLLLNAPAGEPRQNSIPGRDNAQKSLQSNERAAPVASQSADVLRKKALEYTSRGQYAQAIAAYQQLLRLDKRDADAWHHLAELYAWTGSYDRAIVTFQDALAIHPKNTKLKTGLARILRWMSRHDEAETLYRQVIADAPEDREALEGLAEVCAQMGNFKEAGLIIEHALRLYPLDAELYKDKGNILAWQKQYKEAVSSLIRASELSPNYTAAYVTLGDVYFWMKSYDKAIDAYKKALALEPDNIDIHMMLARIYQLNGDQLMAVRHAKRALAINPVNARANEILRELEGRRWYSTVKAVGHQTEYLAFFIVFSLVYLNYRRNRPILRRRHRFYYIFAHIVLPIVAGVAFIIYLAENWLIKYVAIDPDIFHIMSESVVIVILGISFVTLLYAERHPIVSAAHVILAIGAHPDDIELGCGGYLLMEKDRGAEIYGLTVSRGERGVEKTGDRTMEQQKAAEFLGLDKMWNLGMPDTGIREHLREVIEAIEDKIRETGATVILTHTPYDVHSDHLAVFDATKEAARNVPTVLCYEGVSTAKEFVPNYFADITEYIGDKVRLLAYHQTQKLKHYMDPEAIRGRASHRGLQSGVDFAEAFTINRVVA